MTCWNPNYDRIAIGTNADADKPSYLSNHVMCMVGGGPVRRCACIRIFR